MSEVSGWIRDDDGVVWGDVVQRTFVDVSAIGDSTLVAAQGAGKSIRVLALKMVSTLAVAVRLKSAGNNLSASFSLGANGDLTFGYLPHGWFQTNPNEAFVLNQSLAVNGGVHIVWCVVD